MNKNIISKVKRFFSNVTREDKPVIDTPTQTKLTTPEQTYDFVEKYTLIHPKNVMCQYELFSLCNEIPVAVERDDEIRSCFCTAINFPTHVILPFIRRLESAPYEISQQSLMRTFYTINLLNNNKAYVFPNVRTQKAVVVCVKRNAAFDFNPQINKAIADCMKQYTR